MHELHFVTTLAAALAVAVFLGALTQRLGLSPIVGYLFAGICIGPYTPGFQGDAQIAAQLAEIGVILLMFGVGLKFHLKDLWAVRNVAIGGALIQSAASTLFGMVLFWILGLTLREGFMLGMAMAVASTVVLVRVLMDRRALDTTPGRVAVGWLIVEDIFTIVVLVLVPLMGTTDSPSGQSIWTTIAWGLLKLGTLVAILVLAGSRAIPWLLIQVARLRNRELFTLTVLAISLAAATAAALFFGVSVAVGAFLAGMIVGQSPASQQAGADILPMRDAFAVLFFVAVGMLFRPSILVEHPGFIFAALGIVCLVKPLAAMLAIALLGHSLRTSLTVALGLAQIGEFSFILSDLAGRHGLLPPMGHDVLVATALISITINPLIFRFLPNIEQAIEKRPRLDRLLTWRFEKDRVRTNLELESNEPAPQAALAVIVGYGPVGASVDRLLREAGVETIVIDLNIDTVQELSRAGRPAIFGDGSHLEILKQAGIRKASHLILTLPHSAERAGVIAAARSINPSLRILVRARYLRERSKLVAAGVSAAIFEEAEAAIALARVVLDEMGANAATIEREMIRIRNELSDETEPRRREPPGAAAAGSG